MSEEKPTMEEVAGWLREAAGCFTHLARFYRKCEMPGQEESAQEQAELYRCRAAQVEALGWRPIEEAPKDATFVDLWNSSLKVRVTDCLWSRGRWRKWDNQSQEYIEIMEGTTHFMLQPQPPVKK